MTGHGIQRFAMGALALMLTVLAFGWSSHQSAGTAQALTAEEVVQQFADAINAADSAAAAALFTEDGTFSEVGAGSFQASGQAALLFIFTDIESEGIHVTITEMTSSSTVSGTQVEGTIELSDNTTTAAGVSRIIETFVAQVTDEGLISAIHFEFDTSDAETATYLAYLEGLPEDGGEAPEGTVEVVIGGDQPGSAFLAPISEGVLGVGIEIAPGPAGVAQPAHIHAGSCEPGGGAVVYPLASVVDGSSFSIISADLDALLAGEYYINVHESETVPDVSVACGDVEAVVALPDTGEGVASSSGGLALLLAVLSMVGLAAVAGGLTRLRRA
jgi:ketosteroid isomerase-like protein